MENGIKTLTSSHESRPKMNHRAIDRSARGGSKDARAGDQVDLTVKETCP
jgi:hypothetical protein